MLVSYLNVARVQHYLLWAAAWCRCCYPRSVEALFSCRSVVVYVNRVFYCKIKYTVRSVSLIITVIKLITSNQFELMLFLYYLFYEVYHIIQPTITTIILRLNNYCKDIYLKKCVRSELVIVYKIISLKQLTCHVVV